jgi:hypothetical protein
MTFVCNICGEPSQTICVYCTKDACGNHLCERCHRCSDCCECEVRLEEAAEHEHAVRGPEPQLAAAQPVVVEALAAEPAAAADAPALEEPLADEPADVEPPAPEEHIPAPEPEPVRVPLPPPPHPDLSKLFAPEDAPARVFPTSHGPVPKSDNQAEESLEPDDSPEEESDAGA